MILRDYQVRATDDIRDAFREGLSSVILYSPTGSGKTAIASNITQLAAERGRAVLFLGDSTEIIDQTSDTLDNMGVPHGIIQAGNARRRPWELVHVATIQTLRNRKLPKKDIIFVDECHLARAKSWETVIAEYIKAGAKVIGLSATPCRLDGKGLGKLFQRIIYCPSIADLTEAKWLVPFRVFAPPAPDLSAVHRQAGDFKKDELNDAMDKRSIIGDAVEHYAKIARGRLAIAAAVSIQHSKHLAEMFCGAGIPAAHADGTFSREDRRRILKSLPVGEIKVLCQVDICGKGWDCPEVSCCIDERPTESLARWLQFVGRGIRISGGKQDCILLDHAGNVNRFGMPDEPREWSLDETLPKKRAGIDVAAISARTCAQCWFTFSSRLDQCPECGAPYVKQERDIPQVDGELEEVKPELRCTNCHRSFDGVKQGDSCPYCRRGYMKRPYQIKKLSSNPVVAKLQLEAQEKGYAHTWVWRQLEIMRTRGRAVAG